MSKWVVITVTAVIVTVGIVIGVLIYLLKRNQVEEDAADEVFLRSKAALLNTAVTEQLKTGTVAVEGKKVFADSEAKQKVIGQSNSEIVTALASKQKVIDALKKKYQDELSKIKNN
jgi:uncharacterized membrane-anchored protein YhcB (DUF1043 family)